MFFKLSAFERLLKNSYKTFGIKIMHSQLTDSYTLVGGFWAIWLRAESIPKEAKGTMIKYLGELPTAGESFSVREKENPQYEVLQDNFYNLPERVQRAHKTLIPSHVLVEKVEETYRLMQDSDSTKVTAINELFFNLIDTRQCDEADGECYPTGPVTSADDIFVYWGNQRCILAALKRKFDGEDEVNFIENFEKIGLI